ncbi:MAG: dehydrogenase [Marinilabiliales bacterium]
MNILIIGLGSIAYKHISVIKEVDKNAVIYALRSSTSSHSVVGVKDIYNYKDVKGKIDFCIISNPTFKHYETILECINLNVPLFIEKPSVMSLEGAEELKELILKKNIITYVAHNLRFHPVIQYLKKYLSNKRIIEVNVFCGSYLPEWRPNIDYTKNYSAHSKMGGGVHLDLIHEIDYSIYLFGSPEYSTSLKLQISDLNIDSIDFAAYHLIYKDKVVNIILNYYRKNPKRELEIILNNDILTADLLNNTITNKEGNILYCLKDYNIVTTYKHQMEYFYRILKTKEASINTFENSLEILKICLK